MLGEVADAFPSSAFGTFSRWGKGIRGENDE